MKTVIKTSAKTLCFGHYSYRTHAVYYPCSSLVISLVLSGDVSECGSSRPWVKSALGQVGLSQVGLGQLGLGWGIFFLSINTGTIKF